MSFAIKYDELIHLDAEALAEGGIGDAYEAILPRLRHYVPQPAEIEEVVDDDAPSYRVKYRDQEYIIYSPELETAAEFRSWERATYALFQFINDQLSNSSYRFYAINGGNDLGGLFFTIAEYEAAKASLSDKADWPYLPTPVHPWYGKHH
jgi:hypothetical protein